MGISRLAGLFVALSLALLPGCAVYNTTSVDADSDLMLLGYDPVSYFGAAHPTKGSAELSARHRHGSY